MKATPEVVMRWFAVLEACLICAFVVAYRYSHRPRVKITVTKAQMQLLPEAPVHVLSASEADKIGPCYHVETIASGPVVTYVISGECKR